MCIDVIDLFGRELRSTFDGCGERFDHHYSTTMSRNKALPMDVPGPAGDLGPIIESLIRDRTHQRHRMEFNGREIQHCACDNCSRRTVMLNLVYSATKGCVAARTCSANGIDRPADAEDFGNASGMIGIQSMQCLHRIHEIWFLGKPKALVVQIIEVDVVSRNDARYLLEIDTGLIESRIQKCIERHQDRQA